MYLVTVSQGKVYMLQQFQTANCKLFENQHECSLEDCQKFKKIALKEVIPGNVHQLQNEIDKDLVLVSFLIKATSEINGHEQPLTIKINLRGTKYQQYYNFKIQSLWYLYDEAADAE